MSVANLSVLSLTEFIFYKKNYRSIKHDNVSAEGEEENKIAWLRTTKEEGNWNHVVGCVPSKEAMSELRLQRQEGTDSTWIRGQHVAGKGNSHFTG